MLSIFLQLAPAVSNVATANVARPFGAAAQFLPIVVMILFMYLIVFLPESRRRKKLQKQIDGLKQGDKVVTLGHIVGVVDFIGEKTVYLKSQDSKIEIAKSGISTILKDGKIE